MKHFTQNLRWFALSMMVCMGFGVSHAADSWVRTNPESLQSGVDIPWLRRWDEEPKAAPPSDAIDFMNMLEEYEKTLL